MKRKLPDSTNNAGSNQCFESLTFSGKTLSNKNLLNLSFYDCRFLNCDFSEIKLERCQFDSCIFSECNASSASLGRSQFLDVRFELCKLIGIDWSESATVLDVGFDRCKLDFSVFDDRILTRQLFLNCSIREVFFSRCDLSHADFKGSDLAGSKFEGCNFSHCNLSDSRNLSLSPDNNEISHSIISIETALSFLEKYRLVIC
ncbi:Pentapeptide repeats (9 copies) [compost metagenome]